MSESEKCPFCGYDGEKLVKELDKLRTLQKIVNALIDFDMLKPLLEKIWNKKS